MFPNNDAQEEKAPLIDRLSDALNALEPVIEGAVPRKETVEAVFEVVKQELGDRARIEIQWYGEFPRFLAFIK